MVSLVVYRLGLVKVYSRIVLWSLPAHEVLIYTENVTPSSSFLLIPSLCRVKVLCLLCALYISYAWPFYSLCCQTLGVVLRNSVFPEAKEMKLQFLCLRP